VTVTAAPTLDARNTIPARLEKLGMSQSFFAQLCGTNKAEFSRMMNGLKPMSGDQTERFYETLDALDDLVTLFEPCPIGWNDAEVIRDLIKFPNLPRLFAVLSAHIPAPQNPDECWQESVRKDWLEFLEASRDAQSRAAGI
jgi:hypothetical protein